MTYGDLRIAASKLVLGIADAASLSEAATAALVNGCDSQSVRRLAGQSTSDIEEATALLWAAHSELDLAVPTPEEAVSILAHGIAYDILAGVTTPYGGAKEIWAITLRVPEHHFPDLDTFIYAASEWNDRPQYRNIFAEGIVAAASDLVSK